VEVVALIIPEEQGVYLVVAAAVVLELSEEKEDLEQEVVEL
jgi:hypothetical protein